MTAAANMSSRSEITTTRASESTATTATTATTASKDEGKKPATAIPRIPLSLQAVFLASNRGLEVHAPPPDRAAFKVFTSHARGFILRASGSASSGRSSIGRSSGGSSAFRLPRKSERAQNEKTNAAKRDLKTKKMKRKHKREQVVMVSLKPQAYLDALIRVRGYETKTHSALQTAYYNKPTELQLASYHGNLIRLVKKGSLNEFERILDTGISREASNRHGETIVHTCARLGKADFLRTIVRLGGTVSIADDNGRTPLHAICWKANPCFETIEVLLRADRQLLYIKDSRGHLPLSYVPQENWGEWLEFLQAKKDLLWPQGASFVVRKERESKRDLRLSSAEDLTELEPCSRPVPDPSGALSPKLASLVASGKLRPAEILAMKEAEEIERKDKNDRLGTETTFDDDDSDSDDDDDDEDDNEEYDNTEHCCAGDDLISDLFGSLTMEERNRLNIRTSGVARPIISAPSSHQFSPKRVPRSVFYRLQDRKQQQTFQDYPSRIFL